MLNARIINTGNAPKNRMLTSSDSAGIFLMLVIANLFTQVVGSYILTFLGLSTTNGIAFNLIVMVAIQVAYLGVYYNAVANRGKLVRFGIKKSKPVSYLLAVAIALLTFCGMFLPTIYFANLLEVIGYTATGLYASSVAEIVALFIIAGLIAPLGEELVFRSAVMTGMTRKFGITKGIIFTGLLFMISHMNPSQTVYQFFIGVTAGFVVAYSGSVVLGFVAHAVSNIIALLVDYTPLNAVLVNFLNFVYSNIAIAIILSVVICAVCVLLAILILRHIKKIENFKNEPIEREIYYKSKPDPFMLALQEAIKNSQDPFSENTNPFENLGGVNGTNGKFKVVNVGGEEANKNTVDPFSDEEIEVKEEIEKEPEIDEKLTSQMEDIDKRACKSYLIVSIAICSVLWIMQFVVGFM